jgi:5,10-methylenetetrahydromethanopterin reductase
VKISIGLGTDGPIDRTIARARELVDLGLTSMWSSQIFGPDTLTVLALVGREVPEADLGTAVVPVQPRHPSMLAAQARTVQAAIGGHLSLGIGLSHQVVVEGMWGISFDKPATYMNEYLSALAPMLRGETASVHGERVTAVTMGPIGPSDVTPPSLLVAALGPAMLTMTGRLTDGTVLWMTGPQTIKSHIAPTITEAAAEAGRAAPRIVCSLPVCVTDDRAGAIARANEDFAIYPTLPSYAAMMAREGAATAGDLAIVGSAAEVTDRVGQLSATGATEFSANVFGNHAERDKTVEVVAAMAAAR